MLVENLEDTLEVWCDLAKKNFSPGGVGGWVRELGWWVVVFSKFKDWLELINSKTVPPLPITGMGPFQVIADQCSFSSPNRNYSHKLDLYILIHHIFWDDCISLPYWNIPHNYLLSPHDFFPRGLWSNCWFCILFCTGHNCMCLTLCVCICGGQYFGS